MSQQAYKWPAAFVAFCNGAPLEEVSALFNIPFSTISDRAKNEGWIALRKQLPLAMLPGDGEAPAETNARLKAIQENREANYRAWAKLRDEAIGVIDRLCSGELKLEKQFHNRGSVVRADVDPTIVDRVNLATYLQTIANGTYRALGDVVAAEKAVQDAPAGTATAGAPQITIILPGAIAKPRSERGKAGEGQVIDLTPLVNEPPQLPPVEGN